MKFSSELIEQCKKTLGFQKDAQLLDVIPKMTKGLLSSVKNGNRELTDEQGLAIAKLCNLNAQWVLVNLAAEAAERNSKDELKAVWSSLAKKLSSTALALALCVGFSLSCLSGAWSGTGKVLLLRRSRNLA